MPKPKTAAGYESAQVERVRATAAGFSPDENERGKITRQRWRIDGAHKVTVDFLIPPSREGDMGGKLRDIEVDFAAIIAPGFGWRSAIA
jgi:hypothetical protein